MISDDDIATNIRQWKENYFLLFNEELTDKMLYEALLAKREELKRETLRGFFVHYRTGNRDHMEIVYRCLQACKPPPEETVESVLRDMSLGDSFDLAVGQITEDEAVKRTKDARGRGKPRNRGK